MSQLVAKISNLKALLETYEKRKEDNKKAQIYETRRQEIDSRASSLSKAVMRAKALIAQDKLKPKDIPPVGDLLADVGAISQLAAQGPEQITKGKTYQKTLEKLKKFDEGLSSAVSGAWSEFAKVWLTENNAFLTKAEAVPGQEERVANIRKLKAQLKTFATSLPSSQEDFQQCFEAAKKLQEEISQLNLANIPDEVSNFFKLAQRPEGALPSVLTEDVVKWLTKEGFINGVRVRFHQELVSKKGKS